MYAIKNVRLIDGTGAAPVDGATIVVNNGVFQAVGTDAEIPAGASVIDGTGLTAIPGLIEMHTHFGGSSSFDHPPCGTRQETYDYVEAREGFLRWGVTTTRTCGDQATDMLGFRDDVNAGKVTAPRVVSCGPFIQDQNGHPWATVYSRSPVVGEKACVFADVRVPIERQVASIALMGADFIKVFYAHLNKMDYPNPVSRLTKNQLKRVVDSAHRNGLKCACHVDGPEEMMDAAEVGVDFIEHMIGAGNESTVFTAEMIQKVKDSGAVVDPTMISILRFDQTPGFKSVYEDLKVAVKQFYDAGIPLAVGCDSGIPFVPFGESLHDEMACMAECGIPAGDVIRMATSGNAQALGMGDTIGSIEPGKQADLVLLGSDPLASMENTKDIRLVMMNGRAVYDAMQ